MTSILDVKQVFDVVGETRPLLALNYEDTITSALKKLETGHVFGALVKSGPVVVGVVDMQDIVRSLMKFTRAGAKSFSTESIKNLADEGKMFSQQVVGAVLNQDTNLVRVTRSAPLCEAVTKMLNGNTRRLAVVDEHGKIVNIITQFDVVKFLYENLHEFGDACEQSISKLSIGNTPVICASLYECAAEAFHLMVANNVRGIGIVNKTDEIEELVANLSLSDLKALTEENFKKLSSSVFEFLLDTQETPKPIISCTSSAKFQDVLSQLVDNKIHRVYIVDQYQQPKFVISLVDVLSFATQVL